MIKTKMLIALLVASPFISALAKTSQWNNWYISKSAAVKSCPTSMEEVKGSPDWQIDKKWNLNGRRKIEARKFPIFAITTVNADEDFREGFAIDKGSFSKLYLNGKLVPKLEQMPDTYALFFKKGKNVISFQIGTEKNIEKFNKTFAKYRKKLDAEKDKKDKKKIRKPKFPTYLGGNIALKTVNLEYTIPLLADKIKNARLAITQLGDDYPETYNAKSFLTELKELEKNGADDKAIEEFRYKALVLENPVITFDKLIYRSSGSENMPANWRGNSHYLYGYGTKVNPRFNDEIKTIDLKTRQTTTVYKAQSDREGVMDIALDYNGKKFLYSGIDVKGRNFHLYEMNTDGTGKRQITPNLPGIDHYNGIYLPSGKVLFCSTTSLNSVPCVNGMDRVGTLYEINLDGTGMRQVAFDQENDWYPWVKENGRVMYSRWEYTDNAHYFTRNLLEMNPDGTNNRSVYGSNSFWPNTLFYAKQIPGHSSMFSAIVSGHHGTSRAGELIVFDGSISDFEADGVVQRIPGRGKKVEAVVVDNYMAGKYPRFLHPYPLSKNFFLVSGKLRQGQKWALYLVDTFDNMIKIADAPRSHMFEPVPLASRKRPAVIPDKRRDDTDEATLFIQDIYAGPGLKNVPRGTIKSLRIFTYGYAYRESGGHDALAIEGAWDTKRILGTVPFEEDGSLMVTIPANLPLSLQPLDENGQAVQLMKSWMTGQKGEVVSCIGCHESPNMAPLMSRCIAATKAPQALTPWSKHGRIYGFGFKRDVQPILDRYCSGCHDGKNKQLPNFADITEQKWVVGRGAWGSNPHFGRSYLALHPFVHRPGPESDMHLFNPYEFHASTSELFQILNKGHHGVKLDKASKEQLAAWIDLNVLYHATWTEVGQNPDLKKMAATTMKYKKLYSGLNDDDIEWLPEVAIERPEFIKPVKPEAPVAVSLKGWPLANNKIKQESKILKIGNTEIKMVRIPAGKFVMGSVTGASDEAPQAVVNIEKPFWISTTEVTNEMYHQFNPKHDSKSIDQQWKDHVYAGYPAYKPEMPVIRVSWLESMKFCNWLAKESGLKVNLPTESQWEWAARAGSDQPFFFGKTGFENYGNLADQSIGLLAVKGINPQPIPPSQRNALTDFVPRDMSFNDKRLTPDGTGQYKPNPWGLYDTIGNVAEWTRSAYNPYPYIANDGRNDLSSKGKKVVRGGSWRNRPKSATASYRLPYESHQRVFNVGFRVIIEE